MQTPFHTPVTAPVARVVVAALATLFVLVAGLAAARKSLTWDEPTFITSGYTYLATGDYRLNPEAPPLVQKLVALPLLALDLAPPDTSVAFSADRQVEFAQRFIRANGADIGKIAFWSRFPIWMLGGCAVLLCGLWSLRLYGPASGALSASVAALSPNLMAHARLATTDLACAVGTLAAVIAFHRAARTRRDHHAALLGFVTGLALLAKYTSLLLGPIFLVLAIYEWRVNGRSAARIARLLAVASVVACVTVTVGYGTPLDPRPYLHGLTEIYARAAAGYQTYLLGTVFDRPLWYYHIAAFLLKTPFPTLALLVISAGAFLIGDRRTEAAVYVLVPASAVIAASCFDPGNIGLRRILPALPFLFVFLGQSLLRKPCRLCAWTLAGLLIWLTAEAALIYPHHLSYFNVLAGGPKSGPHLMDDSNVDWGQDLPALAAWQRSTAPDEPVRLRYFGTAAPELYGVRYTPMPNADITHPTPGLYAISAHNLVWFRKVGHRLGRDIDWLSRFEPVARAGYSIYIYRFED